MADRIARISDVEGAVAHLVVAFHGDGTVSTLCAEEHVSWSRPEVGLPLCQHCRKVHEEMAALVG
jgi:hypothetical protein